eukprot:180987_1
MNGSNKTVSAPDAHQSAEHNNKVLRLQEEKMNKSEENKDYILLWHYKYEHHCSATLISNDLVFYRYLNCIIHLDENKTSEHNILDSMTDDIRQKYHEHFGLKDIYNSDYGRSLKRNDEYDMDNLSKFISNIENPTVGPYEIENVYLNASQNEYAMNVKTITQITNESVNTQLFGVIYEPKTKQDYPKLFIDFNKQNTVITSPGFIGYFGDILLRHHPNYEGSIEYYDKQKNEWCSGGGSSNHGCIIWKIPKCAKYPNLLEYALCFGSKLYVFDSETMTRHKLKIVEKENENEVKQKGVDWFGNSMRSIYYKGRTFYIYEGCLFELEWYQNKEYTVSRYKHLPFLSCLDCSYSGYFFYDNNPFGMIFNLKQEDYIKTAADSEWIFDENNYFLFYDPEKQIIYRLHKNDIEFKNVFSDWYKDSINIDCIMWCKNTNSMQLCVNDHIIAINKRVLSRMEYKPVSECYDEKAATYDASFKEYKTNYTDLENHCFMKIESNKSVNSYRAGHTRAKYLFHCCLQPKCFEIVAGWNMEKQTHFEQLSALQSKDNYKILNNIEEIGDYLGGPIWYQKNDEYIQSDFIDKHLIHTGTIVDFEKQLRSTKKLTAVICLDSDPKLDLKQCKWVGIVDVERNYKKEQNDDYSLDIERVYDAPFGMTYDLKYNGLKLNYFVVTNGRILCSNPRIAYELLWDGAVEFGNALNGKWFWKMQINDENNYGEPTHWSSAKPNQLMVYHESVKNDKECTDCWDLEKDIFEENKDDIDLENIKKKDKKYAEIKQILDSLSDINNIVLHENVIKEICDFCYFIATLNWIQKKVLNGKWNLHRRRVQSSYQAGQVGVFDLDNYWNEKLAPNPFTNKSGYDWFMFDWQQRRFLKSFWEETLVQSLKAQNACCMPFGCATKCAFMNSPCLAKLNEDNKVICIRIVCMKENDLETFQIHNEKQKKMEEKSVETKVIKKKSNKRKKSVETKVIKKKSNKRKKSCLLQ